MSDFSRWHSAIHDCEVVVSEDLDAKDRYLLFLFTSDSISSDATRAFCGDRSDDFKTLYSVSEDAFGSDGLQSADDHDGIARFLELLAHNYDARCVVERNKELDGPDAYKLWSKRVKKAAGIVLRPPRLSKIYHLRVPPTIRGARKRTPDHYYGDLIPILESPKIGNCTDFCSFSREDALIIVDEEKNVLSHKKTAVKKSSMQKFDTHFNFKTYCPLLFNRENTDRMLGRLEKFLPECQWKAVSYAELATNLLGKALTS